MTRKKIITNKHIPVRVIGMLNERNGLSMPTPSFEAMLVVLSENTWMLEGKQFILLRKEGIT